MSRSATRRWTAACPLGIAAWIGVTVLAGALADDPTDPKPTLIAFAAGGTAFFGAIFGYRPTWWAASWSRRWDLPRSGRRRSTPAVRGGRSMPSASSWSRGRRPRRRSSAGHGASRRAAAPSLDGAEILAYTGRGSERTWDGVDVAADGEAITVRREGHEAPAWLWDLWLAERLAGAGG